MKKVIKGITYNTDTAVLVGAYTKYYSDDVNASMDTEEWQGEGNVEYREEMYRKKDGSYFLVGTGMGKYAEVKKIPAYGGFHGRPHPAYSRRISSCKVVPVSAAEAECWLAEFGNVT